jgi:hypothetical protein
VAYQQDRLQLIEVTPGGLIAEQSHPVFFKDLESGEGHIVDAAVLGEGRTFAGPGEIAVLHFRVRSAGAPPALAQAKLRDIENRPVNDRRTARQLLPAAKGAPPSELRFMGARPNPFNGVTVLSFELPTRAAVDLKIYDVSGRLVRTLVQGYASAGRHDVVWDGCGNDGQKAGVGVYLYSFRAVDRRTNGKIYHVR